MIGPIELARRRFTTEEYRRMAGAGILTPSDRVELIEGEIIQLTPVGRRHAASVARLTLRLTQAVGDRALVWAQSPIRLPGDTEPRPDVALVRAGHDRSPRRAPRAEEVLLLVEVADVSYRYDRSVKLPLYARAAIPEVWLVDLIRAVVEVHGQPTGGGYGSMQTFDRLATLAPRAFADVVIAAADVLPPA